MNSEDEISALVFNCLEASSPKPSAKKRKKPQITSSWTNESTHDLIQAVEAHTCLWEYSCPEYKDRNKRDQAWKNIAIKFPEHGIEGCKAKWANIKTSFLNVKKKIKTKSGQGAEYTQPHWPFWTAMQFYYQYERSKNTSSVSTLEAPEESPPTTSTSSQINLSATVEERLSPDLIMQRALKFLDTDADKWHGVGMYLALQMRELAKKNVKAANKLHAELVTKAMAAILEEDESS